MLDGKKGIAQSIVYDAFDRIKQATGENPLEVFEKALNNIMPVVEVKARRVGGANYQVPVKSDRKAPDPWTAVVDKVQQGQESAPCPRLARDHGCGQWDRASVKKKEDTHKMAEANKAFAHYRW